MSMTPAVWLISLPVAAHSWTDQYGGASHNADSILDPDHFTQSGSHDEMLQ